MVEGALATYGYNGQEKKIIHLTGIADEKYGREKRSVPPRSLQLSASKVAFVEDFG